jgi:hypothetical protein
MLKQASLYENWISIYDFVEEKYNELFGTEALRAPFEKAVAKKRAINQIHDNSAWPFSEARTKSIHEKAKEHPSLADITELTTVLTQSRKTYTNAELLYTKVREVKTDADETVSRIISKYEMITMVDTAYSWSTYTEAQVDIIINYLITCNKGASE